MEIKTKTGIMEINSPCCDNCLRPDSAINPVSDIINASEYDTITKVCSECISMYDGTFTRDEDGNPIFV